MGAGRLEKLCKKHLLGGVWSGKDPQLRSPWLKPPLGATDTHAQKSSTVSNLVTRRKLSCQVRLRSFLKNHRAHLGREGGWVGEARRKQRALPGSPPAAPALAGKSCPFKDN